MESGNPGQSGFNSADRCVRCGALLEAQALFCPDCGTPRAGGRPSQPLSSGSFGPQTLGDILSATYRLYVGGFVALIIIVAVVQVPISLVSSWFGSAYEAALVSQVDPVDPRSMLSAFQQVLWPGLIAVVVTVVGSVLMSGAMVYAVSQLMLGNPAGAGPAYSFSVGRFSAMLGAVIIAGLAVLLLFLTLVGIPLAIYLAIRWSFALQAAAQERLSPWQALGRSGQLVHHNWWRTFGIILLTVIVVGIVTGVIGAILGAMPGFVAVPGSAIVSVLAGPITPIVTVQLYHDLRVRLEGASRYTPEVMLGELGWRVSDVV